MRGFFYGDRTPRSSDIVAERNQFASWREAVCQHVYAMTRAPELARTGETSAAKYWRVDSADWTSSSWKAKAILSPGAARISRVCQATRTTFIVSSRIRREFVAGSGDIVIADPNIFDEYAGLLQFSDLAHAAANARSIGSQQWPIGDDLSAARRPGRFGAIELSRRPGNPDWPDGRDHRGMHHR
jgi:hypothetical protein